jgi:Gas vesicle protein K
MARRLPRTKPQRRAAPRRARRRSARVRPAPTAQVDAIRQQLERAASRLTPRWNADPDEVRRSVLKLVLTLVELIRQLLERQAIRRMEERTMTEGETEAVGLALMRLQETILDLAQQFDISPDELNLDLGPVGKLI